MSKAGVQERAQQLLQRIGNGTYMPEQAVKEFTPEEIKEARIVCFEGAYHPAGFAMRALEALNAAQYNGMEFLGAATSRPAAQEVVEITYISEQSGAPRRGAGFWNGHVTKGSQWYLLLPFGHRPVHVHSWRPFADRVPE